MSKQYTVVVLGNQGISLSQFAVSRSTIIILSLFFISCVGCSGLLFYQLQNLKSTSEYVSTLENTILLQRDTLNQQKNQIFQFAKKIDDVKVKLNDLASFEKKIRTISNLEKSSQGESYFGIGGSSPDDLFDPHESNNPVRMMQQMHQDIKTVNTLTDQQKENFALLIKNLTKKINLLACTPTICPTQGWISSGFGYRKSPFTGKKAFHSGLDISNKSGTKIVASADGIVTYSGRKGLLGNLVTIDHGYGKITRYGHLKKILKAKGTQVKRGEVIGLMGSTGRTTGPHLHYEVRVDGVPVNPQKYILN